jgi:hypothetical protein
LAIILAAILDLCKLRELPKVVVRTTKLNLSLKIKIHFIRNNISRLGKEYIRLSTGLIVSIR